MTASLQGIPEFVAVAEAGGFSAAGRRLGRAKSLLSERITALEVRLGTKLFVRTSRSVALTEAGEAYLVHAQRVLDEAASGEAVLQLLGSEPRGRLRVATTAGVAAELLAPVLPEFHGRHPHLAVEVLTDDRVVDLVAERVDVALRATPSPGRGPGARRLAPIHYQICAAPAYLASHGRPRHPSDLTRHACLLFGEDRRWDTWIFEGAGERIEVPVTGWLRLHSPPAVRAAARAGCGIGLVMSPEPVSASADGLEAVLPEWRLGGFEGRDLWAIQPAGRRAPPKVTAFVAFLAERLAGTS